MREGQKPWRPKVSTRRRGLTVGKAAFTSTNSAPTYLPLANWALVQVVMWVSASSVDRCGRPP